MDKVGTTRAFRVRCTEHRGPARNHWDTVVAKEARESFWIEKYGVIGEVGMNRRS